LICEWHARGIPLALVREAIDHAFDRRGRRRTPRSLAYLARAVEEAWTVVQRGKLADEHAPSEPCFSAEPLAAWRRVARQQGDAPLGRLIESLLRRLSGGGLPGEIDERLEAELIRVAPPGLLAEVQREVDERLAGFADRLPRATLEATRHRAVVDRLRRALGLSKLT
jgi:hypothetical protein